MGWSRPWPAATAAQNRRRPTKRQRFVTSARFSAAKHLSHSCQFIFLLSLAGAYLAAPNYDKSAMHAPAHMYTLGNWQMALR
jgi:hypothetical protein